MKKNKKGVTKKKVVYEVEKSWLLFVSGRQISVLSLWTKCFPLNMYVFIRMLRSCFNANNTNKIIDVKKIVVTSKITDDYLYINKQTYPKAYQKDLYFYDGREIGFISYRLHTEQIGLMQLDATYRNQGIGKRMLTTAISNIKRYGTTNVVFAFTSQDHPFWSNVYNNSFSWRAMGQLHWSITGHGYIMPIEERCKEKCLKSSIKECVKSCKKV